MQVGYTFGSLLGHCIGPYVHFKLYTVVCSVWPALFLFISYWMPDSPYQLVAKGDDERAFQELMKLRSLENDSEQLKNEFLLIKVCGDFSFLDYLFITISTCSKRS